VPYFKHNDIELFYIQEGKGAPLFLISGLGSKFSWLFQLPYFKEKMTVITLHNRGTGKSSRPNYPYTIDMFIEDIIALLDYLGIKEKIHLTGLSMGGMIAQHFVLKYPEKVKTLTLCATTALHTGSSIVESQKMMESYSMDEKFKVRIGALYAKPFRRKLRKDKELYETLKKMYTEEPTQVQDWINQGAAIVDHDSRDRLKEIKHPTLILSGDSDKLILPENSKYLNKHIPNSKLEFIENTGHRFNFEQPEKVNELIWSFIKENLD